MSGSILARSILAYLKAVTPVGDEAILKAATRRAANGMILCESWYNLEAGSCPPMRLVGASRTLKMVKNVCSRSTTRMTCAHHCNMIRGIPQIWLAALPVVV